MPHRDQAARSKYAREWYLRHREEKRTYDREYRKKHREKRVAYARAYYREFVKNQPHRETW